VDEKIDTSSDEKDEGQANDFAVQFLTGFSDLGLSSSRNLNCAQLANAARNFGTKYRVDPGVAALNYGFTSGRWPVANGAVALLEKKSDDAGECLKKAMQEHLDLDALSEDSREWIVRATGTLE
jgi:hypothetical protein